MLDLCFDDGCMDFNMMEKPPSSISSDAGIQNMADVEHILDASDMNIEKDGNGRDKEGAGFVFGSNKVSAGILKRPTVGLTSVQFGPSLFHKASNAWSSKKAGVNSLNGDGSINIESFAVKMKKMGGDRELQMNFVPQFVSKLSDGTRRIDITVEDIKKGAEACSLQLYGYFVGTSMDYKVVNTNLSRMWRVYDVADITKTNSGVYYFKFKSEEGMKAVFESGPWMVNNVPLVLNVWEPGICLEKVEPSTIPIWVCVYNIPLELCNSNGISKIMSGVGKPMLMDKMTKERCLKKVVKLDYARVLVEVSALDDLPNHLELSYPTIGNRPARVGKLEVKYQWKPPLCTHCKTLVTLLLSAKLGLDQKQK